MPSGIKLEVIKVDDNDKEEKRTMYVFIHNDGGVAIKFTPGITGEYWKLAKRQKMRLRRHLKKNDTTQ